MIDWDQVAQLREEVGADEFAEVVELFLDEVAQVMGRLGEGPGPDSLRDDLHFLKGSALNLGFETFGQLCQAGERLAGQGQPEAVDLGAIRTCYDASRRAFLDGVAKRTAA